MNDRPMGPAGCSLQLLGPPLVADVALTAESVYGEYADFAWRTLRRMGVPEEDLADAMQDVFLTVHRTIGGFAGRSSLSTWLFTLCRSVARDRRLRAYRRHEVSSSDTISDDVDLRADVHRAAEHSERLALLESILAQMAPSERSVFVLFEIEGMTGEDIGQALSVPLGTVYSRLAQARVILRQALLRQKRRDEGDLSAAGGKS
jgi:RNA polymerase sigma-70 factor (ECF subfamily)